MKEKYVTIENEYYEIYLPEKFIEFGNKVLDYSTRKIKEYLEFFKEKELDDKVKCDFLINRDDFIERIKLVKNEEDKLPPLWAEGCFYGNETQVLLKDDPYNSFHVLVHETFHLLFTKFVYDKYDFKNRILWLDEALAGNFDDTTGKMVDDGRFINLIKKYRDVSKLPVMTYFNFNDGIFSTEEYNGYELFKIIGRYLIETKDKNELLEYISNYNKIMEDSKTILVDSINYFVIKYNL